MGRGGGEKVDLTHTPRIKQPAPPRGRSKASEGTMGQGLRAGRKEVTGHQVGTRDVIPEV